jgi:hypothetical protein
MNTDEIRALKIAEAVEDRIMNNGTPDELDQLSTHTEVDGVDVLADTLSETDGAFAAKLVVYVGLQYGGNADDPMTTSDTFPGQVKGHFEQDGTITIETVSFDTSSFYV